MGSRVGVRGIASAAPRRALVMRAAGTLAAISVLVECGSTTQPEATGDTSTTTFHADTSSYSTTTSSTVTRVVSIAGIEFSVPDGWTSQNTGVIGTEFQAAGMDCVSAEVIDDPSPPDAGVAAFARAALQICIITRDDTISLEQWLTARDQTDWVPAEYGTCAVLSLPGAPERQLAYTQMGDVRAEISIVVTTTIEMAEQRRAEVADLLENMDCTTN